MSMWKMTIILDDSMPCHLHKESLDNPWFYDILMLENDDHFITFEDEQGTLTVAKNHIVSIEIHEVSVRCRGDRKIWKW